MNSACSCILKFLEIKPLHHYHKKIIFGLVLYLQSFQNFLIIAEMNQLIPARKTIAVFEQLKNQVLCILESEYFLEVAQQIHCLYL
jgi:hypothetical protein